MNEEKFYGLWIPRNQNPQEVIESGVWKNSLSNKDRVPTQIENINTGDKVFLYQGVADIKISNSPFSNFLNEKYKDILDKKIVEVKSFSIGKVLDKDIEKGLLKIKWEEKYLPKTWYIYYRQDGIWDIDLSSQNKKYKALYDIVFNDEEQDYKWWIEQGVFNRYSSKENNTFSSNLNIKNIILYGVPGVGKTHNINKLINLIEEGKSQKEIFDTIKNNSHHDDIDTENIKERIEFITFHQSFGYEDFIEGFRPSEDGK